VTTTLLNSTLWLLAVLLAFATMAAARGRSPRDAATRAIAIATWWPVLTLVGLMTAAGVGSRLFLGYVSPGAYAEEVVGARAFLAERRLYQGDDRADLRRWLDAEPMPADPFAIPGITACQADAMASRPQFYTGQGHPPVLLLASAPIVAVFGGRGVFVLMSLAAIAALVAAIRALARWAGIDPPSQQTWLLAAAVFGWQPVIAGLRQGDAAVLAGALVVLAWQLRANTTAGGLAAGIAGAIAPPALAASAALVRLRSTAAVVAAGVLAAAGLATVAAGGLLVVADYARLVVAAARAYADAPLNYAIAGRLLANASTLVPIAVLGLLLGGITAWRARSGDAAFAAWLALAMLASPIVWSQHLLLTLVPVAVLFSRVFDARSSWPLVAWTLLTMVLSLPDPAMAHLRDAIALVSPRAADVPLVSVGLVAMWSWLVVTS